MHILITGAAGMIGRKLTERLIIDRALDGQPIDKLTLDRHRRAGAAGGLLRPRQDADRRPRRSRHGGRRLSPSDRT